MREVRVWRQSARGKATGQCECEPPGDQGSCGTERRKKGKKKKKGRPLPRLSQTERVSVTGPSRAPTTRGHSTLNSLRFIPFEPPRLSQSFSHGSFHLHANVRAPTLICKYCLCRFSWTMAAPGSSPNVSIEYVTPLELLSKRPTLSDQPRKSCPLGYRSGLFHDRSTGFGCLRCIPRSITSVWNGSASSAGPGTR